MADLHVEAGKASNADTDVILDAGASTQGELGAIGKQNEDIKHQCVDIVHAFDKLVDLRDRCVNLFEQVGMVLAERERKESALVERSMMLARAERLQQEQKAELRSIQAESETRQAENSLLVTENERLKEFARNTENDAAGLKAQVRQRTEDIATVRSELEAERARASEMAGEIQLLQAELRQNGSSISQLQTDLASTRDEKIFGEKRLETLQAKLAESQQTEVNLQRALAESQLQAKALSEKVRELELTVEADRRQLNELEALLALTQKENLQSVADTRLTISGLESEIDRLTTHALAGDKLLADARAEVQNMTDLLRAEGRRTQDLENKLNRAIERQEADAADVSQLKQALQDKDAVQARFADRTEAVIRHTHDLKGRLEKAEQRAQIATDRLATETNRFDEQRTRFEQTIRDLTEQAEKERLARTMVEGALEAARQNPARVMLAPPDQSVLEQMLHKTKEDLAQTKSSGEAGDEAQPNSER